MMGEDDTEFSTPDMPSDFWPEMVLSAKHKDNELGFAVTKDNLATISQNVDTVRFMIWQAEAYKEYLAIKALTLPRITVK
jgi:hypothetical protein